MPRKKDDSEEVLKLEFISSLSTPELRQKRSLRMLADEALPEITCSVFDATNQLYCAGQSDGKLIIWRPRHIKKDTPTISEELGTDMDTLSNDEISESDVSDMNAFNHDTNTHNNARNSFTSFDTNISGNSNNSSHSIISEFSELKSDFMNWIFSGHSPNAIHSICYGLKDLLDPISRRRGVILTGSADGTLKMWDPWHRDEKYKTSHVQEHRKHSGTILAIEYGQKQLFTSATDRTIRVWSASIPSKEDVMNTLSQLAALKKKKEKQSMERRKTVAQKMKAKKKNAAKDSENKIKTNRELWTENEQKIAMLTLKLTQINGFNAKAVSNGSFYPTIHCIQVIRCETWPKVLSRSLTTRNLFCGDEKGYLTDYTFNWAAHNVVNTGTQLGEPMICSNGGSTTSLSRSSSQPNLTEIRMTNYRLMPVKAFNRSSRNKIHRLGISKVFLIPTANYIVTLGSDNTMQVRDLQNLAPVFGIINPTNCRYTGVAWNTKYMELYATDENGYLQIWNIRKEECILVQQVRCSELLGIECPDYSTLIITAPESVELFKLSREIRPKHTRGGHKGEILGLCVIGAGNAPCLSNDIRDDTDSIDRDKSTSSLLRRRQSSIVSDYSVYKKPDANDLSPSEIEENLKSVDTLLYSIAMDNTIRAWDIYDVKAKGIFEDQKGSEMSCIAHVPYTRGLLTGHNNGQLFWWNTDNGNSTELPHAHSDAIEDIFVYRGFTHKIYTAGLDGLLAVIDIESKSEERLFHWEKSIPSPNNDDLTCVAATDEYICCGSSQAILYTYETEEYTLLQSMKLKNTYRRINCISMDGNLAFIGCEDGSIRIIEIKCGFECKVIYGPQQPQLQCCIGLVLIPFLQLLVVAFDRTVIVYNSMTAQIISETKQPESIRCITVAEKFIFVGSKNSHIFRMNLPLPKSHSESMTISESRQIAAMRRMSATALLLKELQIDFAKQKQKRDKQTAAIEILEDCPMYYKIKFNKKF